MSARAWVTAAVTATLDRPSLAPLRLFDAPPVRAAMPYAVIEEPVLNAWNASALDGFEGRLTVTLVDDGADGGERPTRLRTLVDQVEAMLAVMPAGAGGDGWRLARLALARSRIVRAKVAGQMRWVATSEFQIKLYRTQ